MGQIREELAVTQLYKELKRGKAKRMEVKWREVCRQGVRYEKEGGWKTHDSAW